MGHFIKIFRQEASLCHSHRYHQFVHCERIVAGQIVPGRVTGYAEVIPYPEVGFAEAVI
jgi:hypothetical protein